jgi:hypothetical protein
MAAFATMPQGLLLQLECSTASLPFTPTIMLMVEGHDFDASASANYVADVVADEAGPTGYARQTLAFAGGPSINSDGNAVITWVDTGFGMLGGALDQTIQGAYMFADTGDDATSPLLYRIPFADPLPKTDGTVFTIRWSADTVGVAP